MELHEQQGGASPGRRAARLEVLNKSGVVLTCAVWEAYVEDLAAEVIEHFVQHGTPATLPTSLRRTVGKELKNAASADAPWRLAGRGWQRELRARLQGLQAQRNASLNTPKSKLVDEFFERALGIAGVSDQWRWENMTPERARTRLDEFVSLRGDIAHRSEAAATVKKTHVRHFRAHVRQLVRFTDEYINAQVQQITNTPLF